MDLAQISFMEWLHAVFRRGEPSDASTWADDLLYRLAAYGDRAYADAGSVASLILWYTTIVFRDPLFVLRGFNETERRDGIREISDSFLWQLLWDGGAPRPVTIQCVNSMYNLFDRYFRKQGHDHPSLPYWWTSLLAPLAVSSESWDMREVEGVAFPVMRRILRRVDTPQCRISVLSGLNECVARGSPAAAGIIDEFLQCFPNVSKEIHDYAALCRNGRVWLP